MRARTIIEYVLTAVIVMLLGALAGWYFFLQGQNSTTIADNSARGFDTGASPASPFGGTLAQLGAGASSTPLTSNLPQTPQLWHIATAPVSGLAFATTTSGVQVLYVERSTGYVFEADPISGQAPRRTDTLMPKIYDALFAIGNHVYERGVDGTGAITTFAGTFPALGATSSQALLGSFLATNIEDIAVDQTSGQIVYLAENSAGATLWRSQWDGTKQKQLFSSAFRDWRLSLLPGNQIVLAQKAADGVDGYAYQLTGAGTLNKLVGPVPGLTVLARGASSALIFGTSSGGGLSLFAQTAASSSPASLPIHTVADKCVWAPGSTLIAYCAVPQAPSTGDFLDAWYRGEMHSSDAIWRVDVSTGQAQLFFTPDGNTSLDITDPIMDQNGAYIAFLNGTDRSPWLLRLNK